MPAITETSICNSALIKIGQERINSINDATKTARLCKERYEYLRDEVLMAHPWNFALKRSAFNLLADAPVFGYSNAFQIPADCLRIWKADDDYVEYKVEGDKVLCDDATFQCIYIKQETVANYYSPTFAEALACRIAADLAYAITNSREMQAQMTGLYEQIMRKARSEDAQEDTPDELIMTSWDKARY